MNQKLLSPGDALTKIIYGDLHPIFLIIDDFFITDDLIVFNNKKFLDYLKEIYPSQLTVEEANKSDHLADYLDLTFIIDSGGKLSTRLYDKRNDFDFHIVNFSIPFQQHTIWPFL